MWRDLNRCIASRGGIVGHLDEVLVVCIERRTFLNEQQRGAAKCRSGDPILLTSQSGSPSVGQSVTRQNRRKSCDLFSPDSLRGNFKQLFKQGAVQFFHKK